MLYYSEEVTMPLKKLIFKEGDKPQFIYFIKKGQVQVSSIFILWRNYH